MKLALRHHLVPIVVAALAFAPGAEARALSPAAERVVVPSLGVLGGGASLAGVSAEVEISDARALTSLKLQLSGSGTVQIAIPVPRGAKLPGAQAQVRAPSPSKIVRGPAADEGWWAIAKATKDRSALALVGYDLLWLEGVSLSGSSRLSVSWEQQLGGEGAHVRYSLPRAEGDRARPWAVSIRVSSDRGVAGVYSPTHTLTPLRRRGRTVTTSLTRQAQRTQGPLVVSALYGALAAGAYAWPEEGGQGGHFLVVATGSPRGAAEATPREVTLAIDNSSSMKGGRAARARAAALQIIDHLAEGEAFNVVLYSQKIERFAEAPVGREADSVARVKAWLEARPPRGGTDLYGALSAALSQPVTPGTLPIVMIVTDGLPTAGETSERAFRDLVTRENRVERRVFTFGVGTEINTPLLRELAARTRARAEFVIDEDKLERALVETFDRLADPILTSPVITPARGVLPTPLPDLTGGSRLVAVGSYRGSAPFEVTLSGRQGTRDKRLKVRVDPSSAEPTHAFVARLWAGRRVAQLTGAIRRQGGEAVEAMPYQVANVEERGPDIGRQVEEVVRLAKRYGIATEYTEFIARESTDLAADRVIVETAQGNFEQRALRTRSGLGSLNQSVNTQSLAACDNSNEANLYYDAGMKPVTVTTVRPVADGAYYWRGGGWVDGQAGGGEGGQLELKDAALLEAARSLASRGRQGVFALEGELVLRLDGKLVRVRP